MTRRMQPSARGDRRAPGQGGTAAPVQRYRLLAEQRGVVQANDAKRKVQIARETAVGAEENKQKKVAELMKQYNAVYKEDKYEEALPVAMRASELDPDNAIVTAAVIICKRQARLRLSNDLKSEKEKMVYYAGIDAEREGPPYDPDRPEQFNPKYTDRLKTRSALISVTAKRKSDKEREIEHRLTAPVNMNFNNTPLREGLNDLRAFHNINIHPDVQALEKESISLERPATIKLEQGSPKSALNLLLHGVDLTYVIRDEVLQITTEAEANGKLETIT